MKLPTAEIIQYSIQSLERFSGEIRADQQRELRRFFSEKRENMNQDFADGYELGLHVARVLASKAGPEE